MEEHMLRSNLTNTRKPAALVGRAAITLLTINEGTDARATHKVITGSPTMVANELGHLSTDGIAARGIAKVMFTEDGSEMAVVVDTRQHEANGTVLIMDGIDNGIDNRKFSVVAGAVARKDNLLVMEMPKGTMNDGIAGAAIDGLTRTLLNADGIVGDKYGADKIVLQAAGRDFDIVVIDTNSGKWTVLEEYTPTLDGDAELDAGAEAFYVLDNGALTAVLQSDTTIYVGGYTAEQMLGSANGEAYGYGDYGSFEIEAPYKVFGIGAIDGAFSLSLVNIDDGTMVYCGFKVDQGDDFKVEAYEGELTIDVDAIFGGTHLALSGWSATKDALRLRAPDGTLCLMNTASIPGWNGYAAQWSSQTAEA